MSAICVNALLYRSPGGGVEKAILGTIQGLLLAGQAAPDRIRVFGSADLADALGAERTNEMVEVAARRYATRPGRIAREQALALGRRDCRLWHHLGYVAPFFPAAARIVVSVYDIIALTHPDLCTRANRLFYRVMLPRTLRRADLIAVPSRHVKEQIAARFPDVEGRIRVFPLPLSDRILDAASGSLEKDPFSTVLRPVKTGVLCVGDLGPKKNVGFLIECYASLPADVRAEHPLAICGDRFSEEGEYAALIRSLGLEKNIRIFGYLREDDLIDRYRRARVLAYPSRVEGYGFPPLEAMALGTPALVSDRGSLPEIAGSRGAVVSRLEREEFSQALLSLLTDDGRHSSAVERGRAAAPQIRWKDYGQELLTLYGRML